MNRIIDREYRTIVRRWWIWTGNSPWWHFLSPFIGHSAILLCILFIALCDYCDPDDSPKNRYLDWLYKRHNDESNFNNLQELLQKAIE